MIARILQETIQEATGQSPGVALVARWSEGYHAYCDILTSFLAKRIVSNAAKAIERNALYDAVRFPMRFQRAVDSSAAYMNALYAHGAQSKFDETSRDVLAQSIPEGTLDPQPEVLEATPST